MPAVPATTPQRILFVTGRLAAPALERALAGIARTGGFEAEIAVMPISVAALLTTDWVAEHWQARPDIDRVMLPGFCRGELDAVARVAAAPVERGPNDLRDLPEYFGQSATQPDLSHYDIEMLAEINHAPRLTRAEIVHLARRYRADGADVIDLGCDPGSTWTECSDTVKALRDEGLRVSIDSMNVTEIAAAAKAGAELVLSVNSTNRNAALDWRIEVVAVPDAPDDLATLDATIELLQRDGIPFRIDPILEPIGFGLAASLGRFLETRQRYPDAAMMMGVGNLTELTDADSAGINILLAGFCQELAIGSVLTTEVIPWCRTCVRELDLARRLVAHAVTHRTLPKRVEPRLVMLRDPKVREIGDEALNELAAAITDRNFRIFTERGELHAINGSMHVRGSDPFEVFAEIARRDHALDVSHAFYLGYEMAKAATARTLGKQYTQDQPLNWGFLTEPEAHRGP